ncbi:MAG: aldo/keto reductase [Pseudomonadota bacterium]
MTTTRREVLTSAGAAATLATLPTVPAWAVASDGTRRIPATGEVVPAVGLGTWITFNVGRDPELLQRSTAVMRAFFEEGGGVIDSSPMYGSAQATLGHGLGELGRPQALFAADKVWTGDPSEGWEQIEETRRLWGIERFDLLQVHNLVEWRAHLETLTAMKAEGRLRHIGVTTSHGRRHGELARIMEREPIDFVQLTYNAADREAEARLLPLAAERGIGVIVNRPYRRGGLIDRTRGAPLPGFATEIGAGSWAQLLLAFVLSHPAVTVAIPATTRPEHVRENKAVARGPMPDPALRRRIADAVAAL